jgi:hypothetical protein
MEQFAKSYMRKGFLIHEEMRKYLTIYEEVISHIWFRNRFLIYQENLIFFFIGLKRRSNQTVQYIHEDETTAWIASMYIKK